LKILATRKDGQYLRWDARSGRSQGKTFNKGAILTFHYAIQQKLKQIASDLYTCLNQQELFSDSLLPQITVLKPNNVISPEPILYQGSCLELLPKMPVNSIDFV
jgi:DNA modification methylase